MTTATAAQDASDAAQEASYEAEFAAAVDKRETEKAGEDAPAARDPAGEASPTASPATPAAASAAAAVDDLAELPETARARVVAAENYARKMEMDNRSMAGRMSAYQRRYEEAAGMKPVEAKAAATVEQTEDWSRFVEDYPDIAKAIESKFAATQPTGAQAAMKDVVEFVEAEKRSRFLHDAWDAVESVHAGWRDTGKTPEFQAWRKTSQTYDKLAASDDIADAIALFDLYEAHQARAGHAPQADPADTQAAAQLAARRTAQSEGAQTPVNRKNTPNENVDLGDPDQLFAFYASKSNQRLRDRYK